jgi:hypothetical protein
MPNYIRPKPELVSTPVERRGDYVLVHQVFELGCPFVPQHTNQGGAPGHQGTNR